MAQREQIQPQRHTEEEIEPLPEVMQSAAQFDLDAVLDDIDAVLESNATAFVQGFVQKGGE